MSRSEHPRPRPQGQSQARTFPRPGARPGRAKDQHRCKILLDWSLAFHTQCKYKCITLGIHVYTKLSAKISQMSFGKLRFHYVCTNVTFVRLNKITRAATQGHSFPSCSRRILRCLDHIAEGRTAPDPGAVRDDLGRAGDERSVVCVELARLIRTTVVVRVTDRWQGAVGQALRSDIHLEGAGHFVDHLLSGVMLIVPTWLNISQCQ